ncbi:hypothetical protein FRC07_000941 [Ceratobasidium sp. 392]|nr:hypothetical protein FRC07_000941 [Ceratobasidium sp. 392]
MLSPSPSVSVGVGLGRERTPSGALAGRESSVALNRMSVSRATGAPIRASLSASNPFASLGKSSSVAPERKKSSLVWDDTLGVTSASNAESKGTLSPSAKNTAERLLNALENMHTHTGDAQRPRRRPPPSVQVPSPAPSVPNKLKRMIQPYGEVKVSPKAKGKGVQSRPMSGLMKILMKNKKESEVEDMEVEESPKPAESNKLVAPKPSAKAEEMVSTKDKNADKAADVDMDAQPAAPTASPALKVIDNFRPASQPPSRPGTSSSLRQSKTITKRAHVPSAGRNRFSANNDDVEEEDEEAAERRNAELVAVANANVFKVPEGFKFGGSVTPALAAPKPVEIPKPDSTMNVISPKPVPAKSTPTPILSFTPIAAPRSDAPPPKPVFFSESAGSKSEVPKIQNPFVGIVGVGLSKPEIKVPEVPKWGSAPPPPALTSVAKPSEGGVSVFANIGVSTAVSGKPAAEPAPFSFGKPAEISSAPAPAKASEPAKPQFGAGSGFSFGKPPAAPAPAATTGASANPFAGIGANNKNTTSAPIVPFSLGATKSDATPAPTFSFGKPPVAEKSESVPEVPKPAVEAPKPSVSPFSFASAPPAEKPAAPSPAPSFSFGVPPASTPAPVPAPPAPTPAPVFSFGAPTSSTPAIVAPTPQAAASPFSFGTPAPSTASPAPGAPGPPKTSPFAFSAPAPTPAAVPAPAPAPAEAPKKSPFDFSSAPAPAPTTTKSLFDFSSAAKPADKPASSFTFGASAPAAAPAATEKKSPFDFSSIPKPASTGFVFGAPASTPAPAPAAPTTNGFTFGAPAPLRPATPPSGGDAAMEESPTREPAKIVTSGFGNGFGSQPPNSSFAFGSNTNGTGASSTGPFGGPLNTGATSQTNGFNTSAAPASPAPFAFGANNTSNGFGSGGFNTNGSAAPTSTPSFTFGAGGGFPQPASASASPSNPFTLPTTNTPFGSVQSARCYASDFLQDLHDAHRARSATTGKKGMSETEKLERAARKAIRRVTRGERDGLSKKPSRGLNDRAEVRNAILGRIAARPAFQTQTSTVFSATEARPEDLEAPGTDEGGVDLQPDIRIEVGSFVELRRNGYAQWGISLGYDTTYDGLEVTRTILSTGETIRHPARDIQFSVAGFAPAHLARRAGEGKYADENNPAEIESRIALGKLLRSLSGRIEQTSRIVQNAADKLYERARHPDGKTWSKITLAEGVDLVAPDKNPTLELTYAVHQHFMDNPLKYIADTFEHRLSNTFSVRPLEDIQRIQRVIEWVRNNDPIIDEFAAKARSIIGANVTRKRESRNEEPTWVGSIEDLPELNEADRDIVDFCRNFLRQRRELQENPCALILPLILNKLSSDYLPLVGHSSFRILEELSVLAPWSNHVMQDVDLQLHEFTDTLDTPLPSRNSVPPVAPVTINDTRISGSKTVDGLDNMRHDFGNLAVYVVDDVTAEELDDGVSVERTTDGSGNVWLHVHIADPTSALRPNDPLALDAARRTATAYFPDATFAMLPPTDLSLSSLAGDNRDASMNVLTFSALITPAGDILKHQVRPGIVRRVHILQYDDVTRALGQSLIDPVWPFGKPATEKAAPKEVPSEAMPDLQLIHQTTNLLAQARVAKTDCVLWSQPRPDISMDKVKLLTAHDPRPLPRIYRGFPKVNYSVHLGTVNDVRHALDASRAMIAECAITTGRVASLFAQEHGIPIIYRSLARPTGVGVDRYQPLLPSRDPYQGTVLYRDAIVQQLAQVSVQPMLKPATHWQLGISAEEGYVRATSPLRRYLDMLCHWQIKSALHPKSMGVKPPFSTDELKAMMVRQHLQEQARRRAGTTAGRLWAMRCIQDQIARGGHATLRSLEAIVIADPVNTAHSLEQVVPIMIPKLGLPATVYGCDTGTPPPVGNSLNVELLRIELGYNPRLVMRPKRS